MSLTRRHQPHRSHQEGLKAPPDGPLLMAPPAPHTDLHLLVPVLGRVLAALALSAQLLQLSLALLQTFPFALVFHLVFLQSSLREGGKKAAHEHNIRTTNQTSTFRRCFDLKTSKLLIVSPKKCPLQEICKYFQREVEIK